MSMHVTWKISVDFPSFKEDKMMKLIMVLTLGLFMAASAIAVEIVPNPTEVPMWIKPLIDMVMSIPYIGPFLMGVLKYVGIIGAAMTGVATLFSLVSKALEKMMLGLGFRNFAAKVDALYKKVYPFVAFFSIYNAPPVMKLPIQPPIKKK